MTPQQWRTRDASWMSWALAFVHFELMGGLAVWRHQQLHSNAFDLGYYVQVVWNTAHGRFWRVTYKTNLEGGFDHALGDHVELILLPFALLYRLLPAPEWMLLAQAIGFALSGVAIFLLGRRWGLDPLAAAGFQLLFYFHPAIQGPALYDFHPLVLAVPFLLWALWFAEQDRWRAFSLCAAGAIACREQVAVYVMVLCVVVAIRRRSWRVPAAVGAFAGIWFVLCLAWIIPAHHPQGHPEHFAAKFGHLGATPAQALGTVASRPVSSLAFVVDAERRYYVRRHLLYAGGPLAIAGLPVAAPGLPEAAVNMFADPWTQRVLEFQYAATLAAFLVLGAAWSADQAGRWAAQRWGVAVGTWSVRALAAAALLTSYVEQRDQYGSIYARNRHLQEIYGVNPRRATARAMMAKIPPTAAVCAQSDLTPHLSHREKIYVFPFVNDADYVLLDRRGETAPLTAEAWRRAFDRSSADPQLRLVEERDGFVLFQRVSNGS